MKRERLYNICIASMATVIIVSVSVLVVNAIANVEYPPNDGFVIVKKEVIHNCGNLAWIGLGYDVPVFYFSETGYTAVLESDYAKYSVGDFFNGPYVCYG